jgi:hypothetical protein
MHWTRLEDTVLALRPRPHHTVTLRERTLTLYVICFGLLNMLSAMLGVGALGINWLTMDIFVGVNPLVVAGIILIVAGAMLRLLADALDIGRVIVFGK